jgi:hypothetical protein
MSKLEEFSKELRAALDGLDQAMESYRIAREVYTGLSSQVNKSTQGLGLALTFENGFQLPVPLPGGATLSSMVGSATVMLSGNIINFVNQIATLGHEAKQHCDAQQAAAERQRQAQLARMQVQPDIDQFDEQGAEGVPGVPAEVGP